MGRRETGRGNENRGEGGGKKIKRRRKETKRNL